MGAPGGTCEESDDCCGSAFYCDNGTCRGGTDELRLGSSAGGVIGFCEYSANKACEAAGETRPGLICEVDGNPCCGGDAYQCLDDPEREGRTTCQKPAMLMSAI